MPSFPLAASKALHMVGVNGGRCENMAIKRARHTWLDPSQEDDCAVQEDDRVVQEGWSMLAKVENSSPQSRLNSGAFCKGPLEPPAEHKNT